MAAGDDVRGGGECGVRRVWVISAINAEHVYLTSIFSSGVSSLSPSVKGVTGAAGAAWRRRIAAATSIEAGCGV